MRRGAFVALSVLVAVPVLGLLLFTLLNLNVISNEFETFDALRRSDSWQKGWVPTFVPETATDIYEEHNIDTNTVYGEFLAPSFSPTSAPHVRMLDREERRQFLDRLSLFAKWRIGDEPVFLWCSEFEMLSVYLYARPNGRVRYWGRWVTAGC